MDLFYEVLRVCYENLYVSIIIVIGFTYTWPKVWDAFILPDKNYGILITGCDSGIGYSLAHFSSLLGLTVFAACLNVDGQGANDLRELENVFVIPLDVRDPNSVSNCYNAIEAILKRNRKMELFALINNAGVMIFGEFEWLTESQIKEQVEVNLLGSLYVTNKFISLIRKNEGRIINITSHCGEAALPGLGVYSATKAGLYALTVALRVEMAKFNVRVISFVPGSFPFQTSLLSRQADRAKEMKEAMPEEKKAFYEDYFDRFNKYLCMMQTSTVPTVIEDRYLYTMFRHALLSIRPGDRYVYSPLRYKIYHFLFMVTPTFVRDWLAMKFVNLPKWRPPKKPAILDNPVIDELVNSSGTNIMKTANPDLKNYKMKTKKRSKK